MFIEIASALYDQLEIKQVKAGIASKLAEIAEPFMEELNKKGLPWKVNEL